MKSRQRERYRAFVEMGVDEEIASFYRKDNQNPYFGSVGFRDWVYRHRQSEDLVVNQKSLKYFRPNIDQVTESVVRYFYVQCLRHQEHTIDFRYIPLAGFAHIRRVHVPTIARVQTRNRLLANLPAQERKRFLADCEPVELAFAEILTEPGKRIRHVYFPTGSFISLVMRIDRSDCLEVGLVGDEGMCGASLILGVNAAQQHVNEPEVWQAPAVVANNPSR